MYQKTLIKYIAFVLALVLGNMSFGQCPTPPATCDISISGGSGSYTLNSGDTLCITSGSFSGTVDMRGGVVINCSNSNQSFSPTWSSGGGEIFHYGSGTWSNGTGTYGNSGIIYNYGTIDHSGSTTLSSSHTFYNYGTFKTGGGFTMSNSSTLYNFGTLDTEGGDFLHNASGGYLYNYNGGSIVAQKLTINHDVYNSGSMTSSGADCIFGGGSDWIIDGGCLTCGNFTMGSGSVTGGGTCGTINISGISSVNNSAVFTAPLAIVDPSVGSHPWVDSGGAGIAAGVVGTSCGCPGASPVTCTVTNTNNSGAGSLSEAINCANASAYGGTIQFNIPLADPGYDGTRGVFKINLTSLLPQITADTITLDGSTQTAFTGNTNTAMLGTGWNTGVDALPNPQVDGPEIEIFDNNNLLRGFDVMANDFTLRGIAIYGFGDNSGNNRTGNIILGDWNANLNTFLVEDCVIGSEAHSFSSPASPNGGFGLDILDCSDVTIQDNVIGFNRNSGIDIVDSNSSNFLIQRNEITANGFTSAYYDGLDIKNDARLITIKQNMINSNGAIGIDCWSCLSDLTIDNNRITGNGVSTSATEQAGIRFTGSNHSVTKNVIDNQDGAGIILMPQDGSVNNSPATNVLISQNEFYSNNTNAIDIVDAGGSYNYGDGITPNSSAPNDCGYDVTSGNDGIDAPVIDSLIYNPGTGITTVYGRACPNGTVEFYRNYSNAGDSYNGSYYGEGIEYKGNTIADGTGNFTTNLSGLNTSHSITTLVYDTNNNTSEFGRTVSIDCMRDPLVWLKADAGFSAGTWTDQGTHGNDGTNAGDPTQVTNSLNFNPGINYDGDDQTTINLPELAFDNGYNHVITFMVYTPSTAATNIGVMGNNSPTGLCNYFIGNNYRGSGVGCTTMPPAYGNYPHLMTYEADEENLVTGANSRLYYSGSSVSQYLFNETNASGVNSTFHVGSSGTGSGGYYFQGDIHEFMVYYADNGGVSISETQRKKVQSYLALKYGLSLNHDYLDSQGNLIKDINDGFSWGMACIGKDDGFGLDQPKSISKSYNSEIILESEGLENQEFVIVGHDGHSEELTWVKPYSGSLISATDRTWKIQNEGNAESVRIKVNTKMKTDYLLVSEDPSFIEYELIQLNEIVKLKLSPANSIYFKLAAILPVNLAAN